VPWLGGRRRARVAHHERVGDAGDDEVTIVAFDDRVELELVAGKHEEPCGVGANGLILAGAEFDELVAVRPQALTEEQAVTASVDALVDPPVLIGVVEGVCLWQLLHTTAIPACSERSAPRHPKSRLVPRQAERPALRGGEQGAAPWRFATHDGSSPEPRSIPGVGQPSANRSCGTAASASRSSSDVVIQLRSPLLTRGSSPVAARQ
jgi:hypothetical protein